MSLVESAQAHEGRLLDGKVAIITGVGPGMGRAIALRFARHGAAVVLGARQQDRLDEVGQEIRALGGQSLEVRCDIVDSASCAQIVEQATERFGRLDVVVQNAHHAGDWAMALDADPDEWRRIMDVNFFGALNLVQQAAPTMRDGGSIILVNSGAAVRFPVTMGAYSSSKAALAGLTRTLGVELGARRIRVNGIFLGPVAGENLFGLGERAAAAAGLTLQQWIEQKQTELPIGHLPTPQECAGTVLFFASELSAPVTGQHLAVNGGQWTT